MQKHLGHASAEMTRRYQRKRDRFKGRQRQGLRPRGASRQYPPRLRGRLENVRLLAAPPGSVRDAA